MTEQELRTLVRQAIARHAGTTAMTPSFPVAAHAAPSHLFSASHALFPVSSGSDADGPCIIEPAVVCNHCGYCKSMGH